MARSHRHHIEGAIYHVICRGNRKRTIFESVSDFLRFYDLLEEGVERFDHQVIAFCLMDNHAHLAMRVGEVTLSEIFHNLLSRYALVFNRRHETVGHLFQGRFRSKHVDSHDYMRGLIRYIHLNPVTAQIVDGPSRYQWSSHNAYVGEKELPWLSPEIGLDCFGTSGSDRVEAYGKFMRLQGLGDEMFSFDQAQLMGKISTLFKVVADEFGIDQEGLVGGKREHCYAQARACAALLARRLGGISFVEMAERLQIVPSALSKAASRIESKLPDQPSLEESLDRLTTKLTQ